MNLAIGGHPVRANLQHQQGLAADQAQNVAQVITIEGRQRTFFSFAQAVHQQGGVGRHRIAVHEPQSALGVVAGADRFLVVAEQRAAIEAVVPHQIGRAHEWATSDLLAQRQFDVTATLASHRQQFASGLSGVVEHQVELTNRFLGGFFGVLLERPPCLQVKNGPPQQHRE
ncbi:hypothetical protein D3C72_682250 [compost metagenome]